VHARDAATASLLIPAGEGGDGSAALTITPESAGWTYCGLRVVTLGAGESLPITTGHEEVAVVPLSGSAVVEVEGRRFELEGRSSVFARITDWAYLPVDSDATISSADGAEIALASARAERQFEPAYVPAADVPVEIRGAGQATRQVTNFLAPGAFDDVDRLIAVEVLTPEGNWSSYPPHKHDDSPDSLSNNEEIYYFRVGRAGSIATSGEGFALHRTYTADGSIDETVVVRDGDAFLVPRGYHGPCVAAPGYPLYYLNVMAGPNPERTMAIVDDPAYAWIRGTWADMETDPRCPLTSADGTSADGASATGTTAEGPA
jgi:5-deoxy-glucuronate isomerase